MTTAALWRRISEKVDRAEELRIRGKYFQGLHLARRVAILSGQANFPDLEVRALLTALDAAKIVSSGRRDLLRDLAERALLLAANSGDPILRTQVAVQWAALQRTLGKPQDAVRLLRIWVSPKKRRFLDLELLAYVWWNLGFSLRACNRLNEARNSFKKALRLFSDSRDISGLIYALCGLAGVERLLGNPQQSLVFYNRAYQLALKEKDPYARAYTCCGMGNALRRLHRFQEALVFYDRAQRHYRELADRVNEGYVRWGRYVCRRELGQGQKAKQDLLWAAQVFKKEGDERGLALLHVWAHCSIPSSCHVSVAALREARRS